MRTFRTCAALLILSLPGAALAELRAYDVDFRYRQEVFEALRDVLTQNPNYMVAPGAAVGRVQQLPTGQILVDATPAVHEQIAAVLDAISARQTEAAPQVTLRYWAVLGTRGAADAGSLPETLRDVLDELERIHGDLGFRVLGNAALMTESGQEGELDGDPLSIWQRTYVQGSTLNAEVSVAFRYVRNVTAERSGLQTQRVELKTTIGAGEFVVLSENTIDNGELDGTLFYIVHWPRVD